MVLAPPPPLLIGLYSDGPGRGKSTVARHLADAHGYTVHSFAEPLRRMLAPMLDALGVNPAALSDPTLKGQPLPELFGCTPRQLMQTLGTEWGRACIHPEVWLEAWRRTLPPGPVVVDDVRFLNEAQAIKALGGRLWLVERPMAQALPIDHSSEGQLGNLRPHAVVANIGDLQALRRAVDALLR